MAKLTQHCKPIILQLKKKSSSCHIIMTLINIQNISLIPKRKCAFLVPLCRNPSPQPQPLGNTGLFLSFISFQNIILYVVLGVWLLSLSKSIYDSSILCVSVVCSYLLLTSISSYGCSMVWLSVHQLKDIYNVSSSCHYE